MARDDPQMKIRLPEELRSLVERAAQENGRTMNSEVVARLQGSFEEQSHMSKWSAAERVKTEAALRVQIATLLQRCAGLATSFQLLWLSMRDGRGISRTMAKEFEHINKEADLVIEEAAKNNPEQVIVDLQAAQARAAELSKKLSELHSSQAAKRVGQI